MTDPDARLRSLPASVAELLRRVLERASVTEGDDATLDAARAELEAAMDELMAAVGLRPSEGRYLERPIPLASELTAEQRAVAELLAEHPEVPRGRWPLYWTPWLCRRWLGLEPGGVLFDEVELEVDGRTVRWPLVHALRHWLIAGEDEQAAAMVDALPLRARVEALVGLHAAERDLESLAFSEPLTEATLALVDAELEDPSAWARGLVEQELARGEAPDAGIAMLLFAVLVAARVPIEPRHDALLRLAWGDFAELGRRCIAAIPSERREAAVVAAIEEARFSSHRIRIGLTYLPDFPLPAVARRVLAELEHADDPKKVLATLEAIAARHPQLAEAVAAAKQALPAIPELRVASVLRPVTLDALDDVRRRQLEIASKLYSGEQETAAELLARGEDDEDGEHILPRFLELRTIVGADGRPRYDAWLYMSDSGTIFAAGTDRVVAEVIQCGVETDDTVLRLALPSVLGSLNGVKRKRTPKGPASTAETKKLAAKKASAKKPAAKKAPAKKPVAKKPVAKKPVAKKPVAKKPVAKKPVAKKPAAKKPAAKKPAAKKAATKKAATKKPAAKKAAAKKPVAKKPVRSRR